MISVGLGEMIPLEADRLLPHIVSARAHGMWTYKPRQGRKAATVVCSTSAVVTLAFGIYDVQFQIADFSICNLQSAVRNQMSYQVIARKYRPQRFAEVVGQEHVTQTLTNAI